jgi:hypothetical protein
MRPKTTERAKRRRQTLRAQSLIASATRTARRYRHRGVDAGPTTSDWLLTAYLVESRRAERLRLKMN